MMQLLNLHIIHMHIILYAKLPVRIAACLISYNTYVYYMFYIIILIFVCQYFF